MVHCPAMTEKLLNIIILGGGKGAKFPSGTWRCNDVVLTSMGRNDVTFRRDVPNRFLINQCQIITFFI